jgi:hypothetical protein
MSASIRIVLSVLLALAAAQALGQNSTDVLAFVRDTQLIATP